jgi:non-homologous end joining protein Ku
VGDDIDPVYFDSPYFVYPDGPIAVEVLRVIGAAMAKVGLQTYLRRRSDLS